MMRSIVWGSRIAVDEVFFRLWEKIKFQLKRWYTSSVPSGQLPLLRGEASCVGAVHALLTHSKNVSNIPNPLDKTLKACYIIYNS